MRKKDEDIELIGDTFLIRSAEMKETIKTEPFDKAIFDKTMKQGYTFEALDSLKDQLFNKVRLPVIMPEPERERELELRQLTPEHPVLVTVVSRVEVQQEMVRKHKEREVKEAENQKRRRADKLKAKAFR